MNNRRNNWKANLAKATLARHNKKLELITKLDQHREELRGAGLDFAKRDEVSLKMRETIAQLATL